MYYYCNFILSISLITQVLRKEQLQVLAELVGFETMLQLPSLGGKFENIWENKYYLKESNNQNSASISEIWTWKLYFLPDLASDCGLRAQIPMYQKKWYNFMVKWQNKELLYFAW